MLTTVSNLTEYIISTYLHAWELTPIHMIKHSFCAMGQVSKGKDLFSIRVFMYSCNSIMRLYWFISMKCGIGEANQMCQSLGKECVCVQLSLD